MAALVLVSCDPTARRRVLTYFFDGVPALASEEGAAAVQAAATRESRVEMPTMVVHYPFQERMCDQCHDSKRANTFRAKGQTLCFQDGCHGTEVVEYRYLHGPVNARECGECHAPHESPNASLLVRPVPDLCLYCHGEEVVVDGRKKMRFTDDEHARFQQEQCTECHDPHGSDATATLLKSGVPVPQEGTPAP